MRVQFNVCMIWKWLLTSFSNTNIKHLSFFIQQKTERRTQNYTDGQTDSSDLVAEPPRAGRRCTRCSSPGGTARRRWWPRGSWSVSPARWCCPRPRPPASPSRGCPSGSLGPAPGGRIKASEKKALLHRKIKFLTKNIADHKFIVHHKNLV